MNVDTLIEDPRWQGAGLEALAGRACAATLTRLGLDPARFEISLLGCDDARIRELNADFRGKSTPTNVLSWPSEERAAPRPGAHPAPPQPGLPDMPAELGDIAISWQTCEREARAAGRAMEDHVLHLLVHAMLHLLGYDHIHEEDAALMEGLEVEILAMMGVADPYG